MSLYAGHGWMDIVNNKLECHKETSTDRLNKNLCFIKYANRAIDAFSVTRAVAESEKFYPLNKQKYKTKYHRPNIVYTYDRPIRNTLCNYQKSINDFKHGDLRTTPCCCRKFDRYLDSHHKHVITGDFSIIKNDKVRELFSMGPKYRVPKKYDTNEALGAIREGLEAYSIKVCNRLHKDPNIFKYWIENVCKVWNTKIGVFERKNFFHRRTNTQYLNNSCKKYIRWLHRHFVVVPVDKASQNLAIICRRFYLSQIYKELGINIDTGLADATSGIYEVMHVNPTDVLHQDLARNQLQEFINPMHTKNSFIYITPKFHKVPVKFRPIISGTTSATKTLSQSIGECLKLIMKSCKRKSDNLFKCTGINTYWVVDNNRPIINIMEALNHTKNARNVETFDFTTLYTSLDLNLLTGKLERVINTTMKKRVMELTWNGARWCAVSASNSISSEKLNRMIKVLVNNTYFCFGNIVCKQNVGIPMGTNCAPQLANLMLHQIESEFLLSKLRTGDLATCRKLSNTYRFIDDITSFNSDNKLEELYKDIYPTCLNLEKINTCSEQADVLDLSIQISGGRFTYMTYDKRKFSNFNITNFPHITSNVPINMCYNIYAEQIKRHFKLNSSNKTFLENIRRLNKSVITRGYCKEKLIHICKKTFKILKINANEVIRLF